MLARLSKSQLARQHNQRGEKPTVGFPYNEFVLPRAPGVDQNYRRGVKNSLTAAAVSPQFHSPFLYSLQTLRCLLRTIAKIRTVLAWSLGTCRLTKKRQLEACVGKSCGHQRKRFPVACVASSLRLSRREGGGRVTTSES